MRRKAMVILAIAVLIAGWIVIAPFLATWLIVERPLAHADAIIVLSGSAVYKERTRRAAELYRAGVAPIVFITNDGEHAGWSQAEQTNPPFVELEQQELIANGVPPDAIRVLPGEVSGTDQEAKTLAAEIAEHPIGSLLIVTSAYHTRRALRTFTSIIGPSVDIGIEYAPVGERTPRPSRWWFSVRGWQMVALEYVKSVVYYAYY